MDLIFETRHEVRLIKDHKNEFDKEAIAVKWMVLTQLVMWRTATIPS